MASGYLSFNENVSGRSDFGMREEDNEAVVEALKEPMKLKDNWALWEQIVPESQGKTDYTQNTRHVASFSTAQDFFAIWNGLPQPSELLDNKRIMREGKGSAVAVDALMIFKEGIKPEWEDKENTQGGHFQIHLKANTGGGQIDEYWNNIVLAMVGGTMDPSDQITGVRLVDKLSGKGPTNGIRIELWFKKGEYKQLQKSFETCMGLKVDGSMNANVPKPDFKPHGSMAKH